jgi:adenylate kinase family enzyme
MRGVSIVGCPGAGKTTAARQLAERHGFEHVELDGVFHQADWTPLPRDEFREQPHILGSR